MYNPEREHRRFYLASHAEDTPNRSLGDLIPERTKYAPPVYALERTTVWYMRPAVLLSLSVILFGISIGSASYSVLRGQLTAAAPLAGLTELPPPAPLNYNQTLDLELEDSFQRDKAALLESGGNFLIADLLEMKLEYYFDGTLADSATILSKGAPNSWWQVAPGKYEVDQFKTERFSTFGNIYMPWSISFGGNFYINGIPTYSDGQSVPEQYTGGGLRLRNEDAERFYELVSLETPVLVRERRQVGDDFVYTATVPGVTAREYMIADIENNTVLAASNLDNSVPIASLTKLMTAVVAAEEMKLDTEVRLNKGAPFITTLIPRLEGSYTVSMYSLLQLLMIESSNEAAEVIALEYGRSKFIDRMNQKAREIGLADTTFTDPSGLDNGNRSSLRDLFLLTQYILENRGFIFELTHNQHLPTAYTNGQFGTLANFNRIEDVNFLAGKVGETAAAGQTSVSLHKLRIDNTDRVIAIIVLGSESRSADVQRLYQYTNQVYE